MDKTKVKSCGHVSISHPYMARKQENCSRNLLDEDLEEKGETWKDRNQAGTTI